MDNSFLKEFLKNAETTEQEQNISWSSKEIIFSEAILVMPKLKLYQNYLIFTSFESSQQEDFRIASFFKFGQAVPEIFFMF